MLRKLFSKSPRLCNSGPVQPPAELIGRCARASSAGARTCHHGDLTFPPTALLAAAPPAVRGSGKKGDTTNSSGGSSNSPVCACCCFPAAVPATAASPDAEPVCDGARLGGLGALAACSSSRRGSLQGGSPGCVRTPRREGARPGVLQQALPPPGSRGSAPTPEAELCRPEGDSPAPRPPPPLSPAAPSAAGPPPHHCSDPPPVVIAGRTLIPLRASPAAVCTSTWGQRAKKSTVAGGGGRRGQASRQGRGKAAATTAQGRRDQRLAISNTVAQAAW